MDAINLILAILTAKISAVVASIEDFLDPTLQMATKAAPAKTVGDALDAVDGEIAEIKEDLLLKADAIISTSETAEVVTFNDGADGLPMKSLKLTLVAHQDGSGAPALDNVRMFTGYNSVNVTVNGASTNVTMPETVYGGVLDVVAGTLTITHRFLQPNGTGNYADGDIVRASNGDRHWFYFVNLGGVNNYDAVASNMLPTGGAAPRCYVQSSQVRIAFADDDADHDSADKVNAWIAELYRAGTPLQFVFPLATPRVLTLTPQTIATLLGSNTIQMDADGNITAEYCADAKLYIDNLTKPETDMIADADIASGKYFIVNNGLYIATSAIARGEEIVVGTNCTQTDLATALNIIKEA